MAFKAAFCSPFNSKSPITSTKWNPCQLLSVNTGEHSLPLSLPLRISFSAHKQICRQTLRMRYRMSVIYGHPITAATRALRFTYYVTKRNDALGSRMTLSPPGVVSEHEQICGQKLCMRDRKSVIYWHPVIVATRDPETSVSPTTWPKETETLETRMTTRVKRILIGVGWA